MFRGKKRFKKCKEFTFSKIEKKELTVKTLVNNGKLTRLKQIHHLINQIRGFLGKSTLVKYMTNGYIGKWDWLTKNYIFCFYYLIFISIILLRRGNHFKYITILGTSF